MAEQQLLPVGDHLVTVVDLRKETSATGSTGITITFEDKQGRRAWRRCWMTERALFHSLKILRLVGFDEEPTAPNFGKLLREKAVVGRSVRVRIDRRRDKPAETEVSLVWSAAGISPEEADGSELAFAVEAAMAARKGPRRAKPSEWNSDEVDEAVPPATPSPAATPSAPTGVTADDAALDEFLAEALKD